MARKQVNSASMTSICLKGHTDWVYAVTVTPDGLRAVSASYDKTLRVWDLSTGKQTAVLTGHTNEVWSVAVTPDGLRAVSASGDGTLRVWDLSTGEQTAVLTGHTAMVCALAVTPDGLRAVSGSEDKTLRVWDLSTGEQTAVLTGHEDGVSGLAVTPDGLRAVSGAGDKALRVWDLSTGKQTAVLTGHSSWVRPIAVTPDGLRAVSGSGDGTLRVWDLSTGKQTAVLTGHEGGVEGVAVTPDGLRAVSGSRDNTLRVWDLSTGKQTAVLEGHTDTITGVSVTPDGRRAVSASEDKTLRVWDLVESPKRSYTNAKVLIVGETGVGKSGLALRLTGGAFNETVSTDGAWATQLQLPHTSRSKNAEREIWLWDFAGQADYRLIHQLYMDETALAVFVFNPQDRNPFEGLAEWDRAITAAARRPFAKLLVAGRCDRGGLMVSSEAVERFVAEHSFAGYFETSALTGVGCDALNKAIVKHIPWKDLPWRTSPDTFRRLKGAILRLKDRAAEKPRKGKPPPPVLLSVDQLSALLKDDLEGEAFTDDELRAVVKLLHGPGAVWQLEFGDLVLLQPERINSYAAAVIHTVRKHVDDIGIIPEEEVLAGSLDFRDVKRLPANEEEVVLRAMHQLFVSRGLCIRERGRKDHRVLVFPSLYTRERNPRDDYPNSQVTYRFTGHRDEVYATLVVRLHLTEMFEKDQLWLDAADFKTPSGKLVGLKMTRMPEGQAEITVYAEPGVPDDTRVMFEKYVNEHLKEKDPNVKRLRHYICVNPKCGQPHGDPRTIELARMNKKKAIFCGFCGESIPLDDVLEEKFGSAKAAEDVRKMDAEAQEKLDAESKELILVGHAYVIAASAGQIYRGYNNSDHGIDGEIEFKNDKGQASGKRLYLQLKCGDSYLTERKREDTEVFSIKKERWAEYWQSQAYPVMLVVRTSDGRIRWMDVSRYLKENSRGGQKVKQIVFSGEPFTADTVRQMRDAILGKKP